MHRARLQEALYHFERLWRATLDTPPHLMTLASSASSLSLGTHHPLSCDTGQSSGALCHNTRTRCHRTRRRPMPQNAAGLIPPAGGVQGVLRQLAPEKRKDVPKARSWCVCMCNAYRLGAHPRRHAVYGWKIRKGNFSFPVTALRTKSSYCTVTRQCESVNKSTQRRTRILSGIFQRETSSGRTNTYAFLTD